MPVDADPCGALGPAATPTPACLPCRQSVVSDRETLWTHYGPSGANAFRQPAVVVPTVGSWAGIPASTGAAPRFIWKQSPSSSGATQLPVMFEVPAVKGCLPVPSPAVLKINADNAFLAVFNGAPVGTCGNLYFASPATTCFLSVSTIALTIQPNVANQLVIYVWNQNGPAMLQYRLDY